MGCGQGEINSRIKKKRGICKISRFFLHKRSISIRFIRVLDDGWK
jgi:hypothetical protein